MWKSGNMLFLDNLNAVALNNILRLVILQVVWCKDLPDGELNFFSVSEDGTVCQWVLLKSEMIKILKMSLIIDMNPQLELSGIKQTYYGNNLADVSKKY